MGTTRADLHVHTCYSDGIETPESLLRRARGNLTLLSICDHDTIAAYDHLPGQDVLDHDVALLPGIEISTHWRERGIHLLAYFPNGFDERFRRRVVELEDSRRERVSAGVRSLREQGVAIRWEHLAKFVGPGVPCRSHVCRVLIEMGYGKNPRAIFERYLAGDRFAQPPWDVKESIVIVRESGGIPVWAHPSMSAVEELVVELKDAGLHGIEVHIPRRRRAERRRLAELARELDLIATGGTDYHGPGGLFGNFTLEHVPESLELHS